ncbi:metastasis-associated in colon cancer protein 1-like [Scleropages formosus]|nr:metastasis-associated in colon cancer protein 1 [Scleropages formosus]
MAAIRARSLRCTGSLGRSKSEGTLIDLEDDRALRASNVNGLNAAPQVSEHSDWPILQPEVQHIPLQATNPFWNGLSESNPFLDDIIHNDTDNQSAAVNSTMLKDDLFATFDDGDEDALSICSDEINLNLLLTSRQRSAKHSGRWSSASDLLDVLDTKESQKQKENQLNSWNQLLNPDLEWLKNDMEAYKMAWLSHRQLTRSCLDLGLMSQSPGWAQTQATDTQIVCRFDYDGGSVQLPDSDISAHIPEGHIEPGEVQEIALKAIFEPPQGLNDDLSTIVTPLLEVSLSNIGAKGGISLEMKVAGEIKSDPLSQVMAEFVCLVGYQREGPFQKIKSFYVYKNTLQVKLPDLKPQMYFTAAVQAPIIKPPATCVWDYAERHLTVGVYGPKHIHPSFKVVCVVFGYNQIPPKLPFRDKKLSNNRPPLLLQLWGKHQFNPKGLKALQIIPSPLDLKFQIKPMDQITQVTQEDLKLGRVVYLPFAVSKSTSVEMVPFRLNVHVKDSVGLPLAEFHLLSPDPSPRKSEKYREIMQPPVILEEASVQLPVFQNRPVTVVQYGVALKSVIRQPRVEYLLEYFKGETMAILCQETVKSAGQSKVKEWYIGFLRGRVGLVHCKNVKIITKDQVIDFSGAEVTTQVLLENIAMPFQKLTYMYSAVQLLVMECAPSWRALGVALGYSNQMLDEMVQGRGDETKVDRLACLLERLKEDCHEETTRKRFLHELATGLLKIGCHGLVVHLAQNTVILSAAVQLGVQWRELARQLARLSSAHIAGYEAPHRGKSGQVSSQAMWKPAYDFLHTWSLRYGDCYRDAIQDLHLALDGMRSRITRQWRQITGALVVAHCADILHASAFPESHP